MTTLSTGPRSTFVRMIAEDPRRLRRRAIRLGVASQEAEDLAQTVLLRAWSAIDDLRQTQEGAICSWIDVIARNAANDLHVRSKIALALPDDSELPPVQSAEVTAVQQLEITVVLDAIRALPDSLAAPLRLRLVDGLSGEEIAARLGISSAAVRQRISRGRKQLLELLKDCTEEDAAPRTDR